MRLVPAEPGPLRRLVPWLVALGLLAVIAGVTLWARQQDAARRLAEGRADAAEAQLAVAEASLTVIARTSAAVATSSAGDRTVNPGSEQASPMSSMLICDGPSSPIEIPLWVPTTFKLMPG